MRALITFLVLAGWFGLRGNAAETATVPIGIVAANQEAFFDLVLRNDGAAPLVIKEIKPRCDCITVLSAPPTLAAGTETRLHCVYRSAKTGSVQTTVDVFGADAALPQASFRVTGFVAEKSWLVSASEVLARPLGAVVLVDLRSAEEFSRVHPQHALNLPLFALKTRATLRPQKLVLIDEGFAPETLLAEVLNLRAQGFLDVGVLKGGIASWMRAGGPVEGLGRSAVQLSTISAAKFGRSNGVNPWLCLEVGGISRNAQRFPSLVRVAGADELEKKLLEAMPPGIGGTGFQPVLIVGADVQTQARIERRFGQNAAREIFYLEGGASALESYRAEQAGLAQHTDDPFISRADPSQAVPRPSVSGRCGSCPQ